MGIKKSTLFFWYQEFDFVILENHFLYHKFEFLVSENDFLILKNLFFFYIELLFNIKNYWNYWYLYIRKYVFKILKRRLIMILRSTPKNLCQNRQQWLKILNDIHVSLKTDGFCILFEYLFLIKQIWSTSTYAEYSLLFIKDFISTGNQTFIPITIFIYQWLQCFWHLKMYRF